MKKSGGASFAVVEQIIFGLIGIIPYLLAIYIGIRLDADITEFIMLAAAAVLVSQLLGFTMMRRFGDQLQELSDKTGLVLTKLKKQPVVLDGDASQELSDVARHFNSMLGEVEKSNRNYREITTKLMLYARDIEVAQKRIEKEVLIRNRLGRYVGSNVVERIVGSGKDMPLKNEKRAVTILFADIRSFISITENMSPEEVITMLNEYFDFMVDIIFEYHGVLDKFVGDELMAVFGLIETETADQAPFNAVRAAIAMQKRIKGLMQERNLAGLPSFEIGIGINTGDVVVGNVGSKNRMDYTVIGDTVNVAARLEQMAEGYSILIGEETRRHCPQDIQVGEEGETTVRNREKSVKYYKVLA